MLCTTCQEIFSKDRQLRVLGRKQDLVTPLRYSHHANGQLLLDATQKGCHLCTILWQRMIDNAKYIWTSDWPHDENKVGSLYYTIIGNEVDKEKISVAFLYGHDWRTEHQKATTAFERGITIIARPAKELESIVSTKDLSISTASQQSWSVIMDWFHECQENHEICRIKNSEGWQPTRLLDVGEDGSPIVKLQISEEYPGKYRHPYVTLSHCWGKTKTVRLLNDNIEAMKQGIPLDTLPKTFQEAIAITRHLNQKFLWIDSLCIIQDSARDWQVESATMESVYRFSLLNIAATASSNGTGGCFRERNPLLAQICTVEDVEWTWSPGRHYLYDSMLWSLGMKYAPLNNRAWVVQERLLAPRILHFGENQLFWECNQKDACETFPAGLHHREIEANPRFKSQQSVFDGTRLRCFSEDWFGLLKFDKDLINYDLWSNIVLAYTRCDLTVGSDKLVALSGVAQMMRKMLKDEYLAGLWRKWLPYHLLWYKEKPADTGRSVAYRAPTWSWASVDGEVWSHPISLMDGEEILVSIIEAVIQNTGSNTTGSVVSGSIKMRGMLKQARWVYLDEDELHILLFDGRGPTDINDSIAYPDCVETFNGNEIWCVPVHRFEVDEGDWRIYGLVLEKTSVKGEYQRLGVFKVDYDDCNVFDISILGEEVFTLV